jgi:hypothetical protein
MKKSTTKKLNLSRETLRILEQGTLAEVAGGSLYTSDCVSRCIVCPEPEPTEIC